MIISGVRPVTSGWQHQHRPTSLTRLVGELIDHPAGVTD
jgi:hypothetical protein